MSFLFTPLPLFTHVYKMYNGYGSNQGRSSQNPNAYNYDSLFGTGENNTYSQQYQVIFIEGVTYLFLVLAVLECTESVQLPAIHKSVSGCWICSIDDGVVRQQFFE
jgi:hypothetical protein